MGQQKLMTLKRTKLLKQPNIISIKYVGYGEFKCNTFYINVHTNFANKYSFTNSQES